MRSLLMGLLSSALMAGPAIQRDKQAHIAAGVVIGLGAGYTAKALGAEHPERWGFVVGVLAGLAKEVYDSRHPRTHNCDINDALATAGGASITFVIRW